MYKLIAILFSVAVMASCGSKKSNSNEDVSGTDTLTNENNSTNKASGNKNEGADAIGENSKPEEGVTMSVREKESSAKASGEEIDASGSSISFETGIIIIDSVAISLESSVIEELEAGSSEAQILLELANEEIEYFENNIAFSTKDVTKKLMGKYEYELSIVNSNSLLTLENIEIKVDYLGKQGEDLGGTTITRRVELEPGESVVIDWGIDWAFLEDGTRKCQFTVKDLGSNIDVFKALSGVEG